ncbi:MAG: RraA family protein [Phycisphaerae bacterium]|nr:RraA family protein [Phycisphaerae bacterium]
MSELLFPGRVIHHRPPLDETLLEKAKSISASLFSDAMNRLGAMNGSIRSLLPHARFAGRAFTVEDAEGGNTMSHIALEMLSPGDVLVIDAKGAASRSCWGGLQMLAAKNRSVAGVVVNGMVRDLEAMRELGVPLFALGTAQGGPLKGWGGNINTPVAVGGVVVSPGDLVAADENGVVVIPNQLVETILPIAQRRADLEATWLQKITAGQSTMDAIGLREKFRSLPIEEVRE